MKIAVYGGSFNPPHRGHVEAAHSVYKQLLPDKLLIIPTNIPPHKQLEANSPSPSERLALCRLAFEEVPKAEISDLEIRRKGKSFTFETVEILRKKNPGAEICIVVGTDMFLSFRTWFRWEDILRTCTLAVLSRETDDREKIISFQETLERENGAKVYQIVHEPLPMSSTQVRSMLRAGLGSDFIPEKVYRRILRKGSYSARPELDWLWERTKEYLSERRIPHVKGVWEQAIVLARRWDEDEYDAAEAGILHDITKNLSYEKQLKLCKKYGIILSNAEKENPALLHAVTGAAMVKEKFGVPEKIADAIRWHTTGKPGMTRLEKIIYLADYTEPNRDFDGVEDLRVLCFENLDRAMELGLKMSLEDIRARGIEPFSDTINAYEWYRSN